MEHILRTNKSDEMIDITDILRKEVRDSGVESGLLFVFIPHTTAGISINENADRDVKRDILYKLDKLVPEDEGYLHFEGNSHSHIKASLMGFSETILIEDSDLKLGTWQGVYFCEFDGPRTRKFYTKIIED